MGDDNYWDVTHGGTMNRVHNVVHVWDSPAMSATVSPSSGRGG